MNLYRVTQTDVGGGNPTSQIFHDRQQALDAYEYLLHHTYFSVSLVGFASPASQVLINNLSL